MQQWPTASRIGVCAAFGVGFGIFYSAWATLLTVFARGGDALEAMGLSLKHVVAIYLLGGLIGGFLVGIAWPLTRWRLGAGVVGYVAVMPAFAMIAKGLADVKDPAAFWFVVLVGSSVGFFAAVWIWSDEQGRSRDA